MAKKKLVFNIEEETILKLAKMNGVKESDFDLARKMMKGSEPIEIDLERIVNQINSSDKIYIHAVVALLFAQIGNNYMDTHKIPTRNDLN